MWGRWLSISALWLGVQVTCAQQTIWHSQDYEFAIPQGYHKADSQESAAPFVLVSIVPRTFSSPLGGMDITMLWKNDGQPFAIFMVSVPRSLYQEGFTYLQESKRFTGSRAAFQRGGHQIIVYSLTGDSPVGEGPGTVDVLSFEAGDRRVMIGVGVLKSESQSPSPVFSGILDSLKITGPCDCHMRWSTGE